MFPLTFQTENVADMSEDTTRLVANFVARNMDRVPSTDYVRQHTYCVMLYTGDSLCLSALVLARVVPEHVGRKMHELNSFCVDHEFRRTGLGSELLRHTREQLQGSDYLKLFVDAGASHDRLVRFYQKNGMYTVYSNDVETCLQSTMHSDGGFLRGLVLSFTFLGVLVFAVTSLYLYCR